MRTMIQTPSEGHEDTEEQEAFQQLLWFHCLLQVHIKLLMDEMTGCLRCAPKQRGVGGSVNAQDWPIDGSKLTDVGAGDRPMGFIFLCL